MNSSIDANTYEWSFGDGNTSTAENPTHKYEKGGTYAVTLKAFSKNEKKSHTKSQVITILDTKLKVTVEDFYFNYIKVEGVNVVLYTSFEDWQNVSNPKVSGVTDSNGEITLSGLAGISYYVKVDGYDANDKWYDNWDFPNYYGQEVVATGDLDLGEINTFTASAIYDENR
jgi:PKD repeat protein